jgi:ATP-dependent phosphofructokinase / diphosphate-dependent phosphofructokinase
LRSADFVRILCFLTLDQPFDLSCLMSNNPLRIGILTGGGDSPGLNAVIRSVTKCLILHHNAEVIGFLDGFEGLIERKMRPLNFTDVSGILTLGGTILGASNKGNPFNYYRRSGADVTAEVLQVYKSLRLDGLVVIGGDGSMSIAHGLEERGLRIVGVPKTIDNDLMETERTFGFDTAVAICTEAIDRIHTTAQSHNRVMIIETMGRYAGWIALYSGVAGGADVILIPELPYDINEVVRVCRERENGGQRFTIVVVAEGARAIDGKYAIAQTVEDSTDPVRLGGIGKILEMELRDRVDSEVRTTILGHMQRGGTPTAYDRNLATAFGTYAASLVAEGIFGQMVALQQNRLTCVPLEKVANRTRTIAMDAPMLAAAAGVGTSFGVKDLHVRLPGTQASEAIS